MRSLKLQERLLKAKCRHLLSAQSYTPTPAPNPDAAGTISAFLHVERGGKKKQKKTPSISSSSVLCVLLHQGLPGSSGLKGEGGDQGPQVRDDTHNNNNNNEPMSRPSAPSKAPLLV